MKAIAKIIMVSILSVGFTVYADAGLTKSKLTGQTKVKKAEKSELKITQNSKREFGGKTVKSSSENSITPPPAPRYSHDGKVPRDLAMNKTNRTNADTYNVKHGPVNLGRK